MTTQRVTIELPEPVFRQLARIAQATQQAADHLMLRKAYAWSVLRWRGHRLPRKELPISL